MQNGEFAQRSFRWLPAGECRERSANRDHLAQGATGVIGIKPFTFSQFSCLAGAASGSNAAGAAKRDREAAPKTAFIGILQGWTAVADAATLLGAATRMPSTRSAIISW